MAAMTDDPKAKSAEQEKEREILADYDPANDQHVYDVTIPTLYKTHSLTALAVFIGVVFIFAFNYDSDAHSFEQNVKSGLKLGCFVFLLIGLLVFPSGPFIRPHPMFWKLLFGVSFLYQLYLILLLSMNLKDARASFAFFYPELNKPLAERSYAADCDINWETLSSQVFDRYFLSHFLGWAAKSMMMRDQLFCWTISVGWELLEIAFTHMLPNFAECWWDQWVLDVMIANGLGIYVGHKVGQYLEMKQYKWSGLYTIPTLWGKTQRMFLQFTPSSWIKVRWESAGAIKQFLAYNMLMFSLHLVELNAFFLKHILWIPPENNLNLYRLIMWWLIGCPSLRQVYMYLTDPRVKRLGAQTWLAISIQLTELLIIIKFGRGQFPNPMPEATLWGWIGFAIVYILFCAWLFISWGAHDSKKGKKE
eukprot:TRINITY_DN3973_c0_g1_i1.p1 TRINITY_DN3973_c0_g1~~TRINITY_DN3973_c0_g1_i1.p1  ORF type:complete len:420 (-),score=117.17 TRINITY_DN3973_c0_g1_i1:185-1444(-)